MKKVVTPAWNKTVAFRDECSKMMSKTVSEDFLAEFAIKRLGNKPAIKNHMMDLKVIYSDFCSFINSQGNAAAPEATTVV